MWEQFFKLPILDRILTSTIFLIVSGVILKFIIIQPMIALFTKRKMKLKVGSVELNNQEEKKIEQEPNIHANCAKVADMFLLLRLKEEALERRYDVGSNSSILSAQITFAEIQIDNYATNIMSQLAEHDDYENLCRDIELMKFRLIQKLVLIFRENHLSSMTDSQFFQHLRNRSQQCTNMSIVHLRKGHPFYQFSNANDVMVLVVQIIEEARNISKAREEEAKQIDKEFDEVCISVLNGTYGKK